MLKCNNLDHLHQRFNAVLIYIQNHLDEDLSLEKLSEIANLSTFHFHRQFHACYNETLHDYIKRLRLEKAAFIINHSDTPITEIGFSSGYETSSAFSKAFKKRFGITPRAYRKNSIYTSNCEIADRLTTKIVTRNDQHVLFHRETGGYQEAASKAWRALMIKAYENNLVNSKSMAIGITNDSPYITDNVHIRYDACLSVDKGDVEKIPEMVQIIPGGKYAIFQHKGSYHGIDSLYDEIYSIWLPASGHTLKDQLSFCHYHQLHSQGVPENQLITDIYISIE